ncbi:TIR domain-containing protein [Flavobacterium sp.]|uniref:toll/interleukin-1 receptor domain-containing protein n=1 Tax=Flavobacterium sp. TaxID=239 RepID=UPI00261B4B1A|nr:TIR domain-containing protein [Flavobacterium sp.]
MRPDIYISYAWEKQGDGTNWSPLLKNLHSVLIKNKFSVKIDVSVLQYKDSIREFMRDLGKGNYIVVVITEKFLKSKNCMFEVLEMLRYKDTRDRIFPIIANDAKIYDSLKMVEYIKFWDEKIKELSDEAKSLSNIAYATPIFEDIELMSEIRRIFSNFGNMLSEMNVLTPEKHQESEFDELITKINLKLEIDKQNFELKSQNEEFQMKISELENLAVNLKLENSQLILDVDKYKKVNKEQKSQIDRMDSFAFINEKLQQFHQRVLNFNSFLYLNKNTTKADILLLLGNPTEEEDKNADKHRFYYIRYENFISINLYKETEKIMSVEVSLGYSANKFKQYLDYKSLHDINLHLLDKTPAYIIDYLGEPTDNYTGSRITYETEDVTVTFTCYDFHDNKCSSIEVMY